jgi:hypothetical protein
MFVCLHGQICTLFFCKQKRSVQNILAKYVVYTEYSPFAFIYSKDDLICILEETHHAKKIHNLCTIYIYIYMAVQLFAGLWLLFQFPDLLRSR